MHAEYRKGKVQCEQQGTVPLRHYDALYILPRMPAKQCVNTNKPRATEAKLAPDACEQISTRTHAHARPEPLVQS